MKRILFGALLLISCNYTPVVKENNEEQKSVKTDLKKSMTLWKCSVSWIKEKKVEYKEYNPQGDITKWIQYDKQGEICEQFDYVYKGSEKAKETREYCTGELESTILFHYDSLNRIKKEETLDEQGKPYQFVAYQYLGNKAKPSSIEFQNVNDSNSYSSTQYTYFSNDLLKEEVQTSGGSWVGTNSYKYDKSGNMIYMGAEVDGGVGLVEYHYIYDKALLVKDSVNIPDTTTEYHIYEYQFF